MAKNYSSTFEMKHFDFQETSCFATYLSKTKKERKISKNIFRSKEAHMKEEHF